MQQSQLETERFWLVPVGDSDQDIVFQGLSDPRVTQYYGVSYNSYEATKAQMDFYARHWAEGTGAFWMVVERSSGLRAGVFGGYHFQPQHQKLEIGYWLLPKFWGKGIASEVMPVFLKALIDGFHLHRIEAWVEAGNEASCLLLELSGFVKEGFHKDTEIKNGQFISLMSYALLVNS
ncbi:GNAT family N-acetyltransferase [Flavihumibacter rivuli]|uniref:GNAT family N-acetyltransferase n=1 Tax=Flavihumibacter rivuli TaxID=2838156 RepID=UPI001BDE9517|nr:GNAT family N-acetyltransferase [Flavihumibacter rivuli]ULQ57272.1 GNAT family N-acetyltransferase [Flavihumibacter rivuli]